MVHGFILKITVMLLFCGRTLASGLPSAIETPVVVLISEAAGGNFFITRVTIGFKSQRLKVTILAGYDTRLPIFVKSAYT